jgi:hypothetical protein
MKAYPVTLSRHVRAVGLEDLTTPQWSVIDDPVSFHRPDSVGHGVVPLVKYKIQTGSNRFCPLRRCRPGVSKMMRKRALRHRFHLILYVGWKILETNVSWSEHPLLYSPKTHPCVMLFPSFAYRFSTVFDGFWLSSTSMSKTLRKTYHGLMDEPQHLIDEIWWNSLDMIWIFGIWFGLLLWKPLKAVVYEELMEQQQWRRCPRPPMATL